MSDFLTVTELPGEPISREQLERLVNRYSWAAEYCRERHVVEAGCGCGPGLGLLAAAAASVEAGDLSQPILQRARAHYGDRIALRRFDAQELPFADASKDAVLLFEALYYLPQPERFVKECARVLRPGGRLLIVTANKDLWDFHPSPHSHAYYGVRELEALLSPFGFTCEFFGFQAVRRTGPRQKLLRPVKRLAVLSGLMPKTMAGKRWLRRLVFGAPLPMPAEITAGMAEYVPPQPLPRGRADHGHKIVYCVGTKEEKRC